MLGTLESETFAKESCEEEVQSDRGGVDHKQQSWRDGALQSHLKLKPQILDGEL